jgi:hypothetical protein
VIKGAGGFSAKGFSGKDMGGYRQRCGQQNRMDKGGDSEELCGSVAVSRTVGSASVGVRVCDDLPVDYVRMNKKSDARHVPQKEHQQQAGKNLFLLYHHISHSFNFYHQGAKVIVFFEFSE